MVKKFQSVAEVMADQIKAKNNGSTSPLKLGPLWVRTVAEKYDEFVPALRVKEASMLKQLAGRVPEGQAAAVIVFAIQNWVSFSKRVADEAGWRTVPSKPQVAFLLQHVGIAVNMMAPKTTSTKEYEAPKSMSVQPTVQLISQEKPAAKTVTTADLLAVLNES